MKKRVQHLFSALAVSAFVIMGIGSGDDKTSSKAGGTTSSDAPKQWTEVYSFSGSGMKKSSLFELTGNEARLKYKYSAPGGAGMGAFAAYVVEEGVDIMKDGGIPDVMVQAENEESESSLQKSAGKYYLNVSASGQWTVTVEEMR